MNLCGKHASNHKITEINMDYTCNGDLVMCKTVPRITTGGGARLTTNSTRYKKNHQLFIDFIQSCTAYSPAFDNSYNNSDYRQYEGFHKVVFYNNLEETVSCAVIGYPSGEDGAILPARDTGFVSQIHRSSFGVLCHIINPLLTKLDWSRWLDSGLVLFFFLRVDGQRLS